MRAIYSVIVGGLLTACNPFGIAKPDSERIIKAGWADTSSKPPSDSLYCYRTLGDSVCYREPVEGEENRLAGHTEPLTLPSSPPRS